MFLRNKFRPHYLWYEIAHPKILRTGGGDDDNNENVNWRISL